MFKKIFLIIIFLFSVFNIYSYTNVSSCQTINSSFIWNDAEKEIRLNNSILVYNSSCMDIEISDATFNCQNNLIQGNYSGNGFYLNNNQNFILKNCMISNFAKGIDTNSIMNNITISNITLTNISHFFGPIGLSVDGFNNSLIENITLKNMSGTSISLIIINSIVKNIYVENSSKEAIKILYANNLTLDNILINGSNVAFGTLRIETSYDSNYNNIEIINSDAGIYLTSGTLPTNNFLTNITLKNILYQGIRTYSNAGNFIFDNIYMENVSSYAFGFRAEGNNIVKNSKFVDTNSIEVRSDNNLFYNNTILSSTPFISSSADWSFVSGNKFNLSDIGNYYSNVSSNPFCFDTGNLRCDYFAQNYTPVSIAPSNVQSVSVLPAMNLYSLLASIGVLFLFILF
jgi:hypothetical protein